MIVKGKYKYQYSTVNLRVNVAKRFRAFSKKVAKSHSETMTLMMDFFEWHGFNPSNKFSKSILQELLKNRQRTETSIKRTEASIAIIRDIEINQTKPNNAMLLSLFGEKIKEEEPIRKEKKLLEKKPKQLKDIEITVPKIRYERIMDKMEKLKKESQFVIDHITLVKPSFGKSYLKLEITDYQAQQVCFGKIGLAARNFVSLALIVPKTLIQFEFGFYNFHIFNQFFINYLGIDLCCLQ